MYHWGRCVGSGEQGGDVEGSVLRLKPRWSGNGVATRVVICKLIDFNYNKYLGPWWLFGRT